MYNVLDKKLLAPGLMRIDVSAPDVAAKARPGQFVIVRVVEDGERIPLTIGGADEKTGSITLLVQMVGLSTTLMGETPVGGKFASVTGHWAIPLTLATPGACCASAAAWAQRCFIRR